MARQWVPRGLALTAFVLYACAAPASHYWLDSGELSAAGLLLGSAHPTGFPLYCILIKLAAFIPIGELGFRVNLVSSLCAALAVLWVVRLVVDVRADAAGLGAGVAAGLALALSMTFFRQATVAEVYAPAAAILAGSLVLVRRVAMGGSARVGLSLAAVVGLGLAMHGWYRLFVLPPVAVVLLIRLRHGARWPLYAPVLVTMVSLASYAYLPVRSATGRIDAVDWGHPNTLGNLVDHMEGKSIYAAHADRMMSFNGKVVADDARRFGELAFDQLGPIMLLAAAFGLLWLIRRTQERWLLIMLAFVIVGDLVFSIWLNPMGIDELQNGVPLAMGVAILAGLGMAAFATYLGRFGAVALVGVGAMVAVPSAMVTGADAWAARDSFVPGLWARSILQQSPPRGIVMAINDSTMAALLYATTVEGARPDVMVLARQQLADQRRVKQMWRRSGESEELVNPVADLFESSRSILWEPANDSPPSGFALRADAPLFTVEKSANFAEANVKSYIEEPFAELESTFDWPGAADPMARLAHASALTQLGSESYRRWARNPQRMEFLTRACKLFQRAIAVLPTHTAAWVNLGVCASAQQNVGLAVESAERALALNPNHIGALVNAARYRLAQGKLDLARAHLLRAVELDPKRSVAWYLLGRVAEQQGLNQEAIRNYRRAQSLEPENSQVRAGLQRLLK